MIGGITAYLFEELGISTSTTLAAGVNPSSTIPSGSVSFFDSSTFLGNVALDTAGQAVFPTSTVSAGVRSITAFYVPSTSAGFAASTSTALNETILDFSIGVAAGGSTSATVKAGQTAMYALQLSLLGGAATDQFVVTVSCTGAPSIAMCTGSPSPVTVTSTGPAAETISVSTKANGLLIPTPPSSLLRNPADHLPILWVLAMLLVLLWVQRKQAEARGGRSAWAVRLTLAVPVLLLAMTIGAIGGCGGGGSTPPPPPVNNGTPAGTYTLTVTAASGNLTHTQQLTLIVQ